MRKIIRGSIGLFAGLPLLVTTAVVLRSFFAMDIVATRTDSGGIVTIAASRGYMLLSHHYAPERTPWSSWSGPFVWRTLRIDGFDFRPGGLDIWSVPKRRQNFDPPEIRYSVVWERVGSMFQTGENFLPSRSGSVGPAMRLNSWFLTVPLWLFETIAIVPAWMVLHIKLRTMWRRRRNLCEYCAYDLRASVDSCPECGKRISH